MPLFYTSDFRVFIGELPVQDIERAAPCVTLAVRVVANVTVLCDDVRRVLAGVAVANLTPFCL